MPEFLAETYAPAEAPGAAAPRAAGVALAADQVSQGRTAVRLLGAIAVPGKKTARQATYSIPSRTRTWLRPCSRAARRKADQ